MTAKLRTVALVSLLPLGLAACGGDGSVTAVSTTPPVTSSTAFQDKFGTTFSTTFNTSANTDPRDPAAADVPALNLTAEPLDN